MKVKQNPELRLSNYVGNWEWRKLNEISDKIIEKNKDNLYTETFTNSAEFGVVSQRDFFDKAISNEKNLNSYYVVRDGDFVYNPRISNYAPVGPIKRNKLGRTGVMSPLYYVFRTKEIEKSYLESYFSSVKWHLFMKLNGDTGARSDRFAIKDTVFGDMPIPYPSRKEQSEIGEFFRNIDETIFFHQQELDTLKQTKQGFLHKMFPKEGDMVPEIRVGEFKGQWKETLFFETINKIVDHRGKTPKKLGLSWSEQGYLALSALNVKNGYIDIETNAHFGDEKLYKKWMGEYKLKKGQVLFTTEAPMGNVAQVPDNAGYILSQRTIAFETKENKLIDDFLSVLLSSPIIFNKLSSLASGGTAKGVSQKSLSKLNVIIPTDTTEQQRIAQFFKKLDKTIELKEKELKALKQTKTAFLQKMFV